VNSIILQAFHAWQDYDLFLERIYWRMEMRNREGTKYINQKKGENEGNT
jgi:hypothetical protein